MAKFSDGSVLQLVEIAESGVENIYYEGASQRTLEREWRVLQQLDQSYAERAMRGCTDCDGYDVMTMFISREQPHVPVVRLEQRHVNADGGKRVLLVHTTFQTNVERVKRHQ